MKLSQIVSKLEKKGLHKSAENLKRVVGVASNDKSLPRDRWAKELLAGGSTSFGQPDWILYYKVIKLHKEAGPTDFLDENITISVSAMLNNVDDPTFSKGLKATGYPNVVAATLAKQAFKMIKSS